MISPLFSISTVVADLDVEPLDLVLVVQRRAGDGRAGEQRRFEMRDRRQRSGSADLDADVEQLRRRLPCRIFVGDRPTRGFCRRSEFLLQRGRIDLYDDAVDLVIERVADSSPSR